VFRVARRRRLARSLATPGTSRSGASRPVPSVPFRRGTDGRTVGRPAPRSGPSAGGAKPPRGLGPLPALVVVVPGGRPHSPGPPGSFVRGSHRRPRIPPRCSLAAGAPSGPGDNAVGCRRAEASGQGARLPVARADSDARPPEKNCPEPKQHSPCWRRELSPSQHRARGSRHTQARQLK
jgi:hypothetical protein